MPFVQRVVEPKYLSRTSLRNADGRPLVADEELQAVTNCTLSNALRQLASLVLLANDIFNDLTLNLNDVTERSKCLQVKIVNVGEIVEKYDPKKVTVPEGSLSNFAARKAHYTAKHPLGKELFTADTRAQCVRELYATAGAGALPAAVRDAGSPYLLCTPVLGAKRRRLRQKVDVDIETRIPASVEHLRRWTSREALGALTALTDSSTRIAADVTLVAAPDEPDCASGDEEPIDHKLPSPEEQLEVIVAKFPPELVPIDTSGKFFDRMSVSRKSLLHIEAGAAAGDEADAVRRRTRTRKPRGKRRNTISGTDQKELREAIAGDAPSPVGSPESPDSGAVMRSHSSDLLKKSPVDMMVKKSSHFNSLKQWGKTRLKLIARSPSTSRDNFREGSKTDKTKSSKSPASEDIDDVNIYETVTMRRRRNIEQNQERKIIHQRNASYSSSEKSMGIPVSIPIAADAAVKLRDSSAQKRLRRSGLGKDEPHSSSGNWSASSESGRTSIGSEITTTTIPPKSTTSATTSTNSLNAHAHGPPSSIISRRRFLNTSGSGSATSEGTLTPDIIHDLHEDMETSSEYSCDTEGYYTSFHMDSGLKTLKEEDTVPTTPLHTSNILTNSSGNQSAENEYELFGKGSTSTTTSSAGTVCTTLMAAGSDRSLVIGPVVPERKSSLNKSVRSRNGVSTSVPNVRYNKATNKNIDSVKFDYAATAGNEASNPIVTITNEVGRVKETVQAVIHSAPEQDAISKSTGTNSPDSGHNTSSSPIEDSISSPQGKHSLSEQDYSESSDLEGTDRIERIRVKTTINSSRIPSMCVITPTNSDDESGEAAKKSSKGMDATDRSTDVNIALRPKMDLPINARLVPATDTLVNRDGSNVECRSVKCPPTQKLPSQLSAKSSMTPLNNFMCKLKGVLPHKLSMKKLPNSKEIELPDSLYSESGDYVTIADVRNNNQKINIHKGGGIYYANDTIKKNLQTVLSGKLQETEYVSLNELPLNSAVDNRDVLDSGEVVAEAAPEADLKRHGAIVTLDSNGKVIYSSDSIRRRKGAHTTFEPGPFVKETYQSPTGPSSSAEHVATLAGRSTKMLNCDATGTVNVTKPLSPQLGKVIIKASNEPNGATTTEFIPYPPPKPSTIITATTFPEKSESLQQFNYQVITSEANEQLSKNGAYVNIHDAEGVSLSPTKETATDYRHSSADQPYLNISPHSPQRRSLRHPLYSYIDKHPQESSTIPRDTGRISNMPQNKLGQIVKDNPYWTMQPKKFTNALVQDQSTSTMRSVTPDITRGLKYHKEQHLGESTVGLDYNNRLGQTSNIETNRQIQYRGVHFAPTHPQTAKGYSEDLKISPIDPRNTGAFHSSTPTGRDASTNFEHKLLSPVKSTMSNEELYAVIHKSKKKLNINKEQIDRAGSPALSSLSLSPVNSESSLTGRTTPVKQPESGYLANPRVRNSWADSKENQFGPNVVNMPSKLEYSMTNPGSRQSWACSDRLGPAPQTSRLDFKKLLLQHGVKLNSLNPTKNTNKVSAVEQLKLSREKNQLQDAKPNQIAPNNVNILDLSGSPKTYVNRRFIRNPPVPQPLSPVRTNAPLKDHKPSPKILLSPKTQWRFASPRSDVLSSPIPEAFNEEESPNNSGEKCDSKSPDVENCNPANTVAITTKQHFGARRNLIPINESSIDADCDFTFIGKGTHSNNPLETDLNVAKPFTDNYCMSRTEILQAKRAEFFQQPPPFFTTFKKPTATTPTVNPQTFRREPAPEQQRRTPSPPALETAL